MLCGCISNSVASLMSRSMYLIFVERSFVSCSLIIWYWLLLCSTTADFSACASRMCLLAPLPCSDTGLLPSTACSYTQTRLFPVPPPPNWLRLLLSQTPTCINTLAILFHWSHDQWRWNTQSVPKCWHLKFRRRGITRKREYNIHNTMKVWN